MRGLCVPVAFALLVGCASAAELTALAIYNGTTCQGLPYSISYSSMSSCTKADCATGVTTRCITTTAAADAKEVYGTTQYVLMETFGSASCSGDPTLSTAMTATGECLKINNGMYTKVSVSGGKVTYGAYTDASCTTGSPLEGVETGKCLTQIKFTIGGNAGTGTAAGGGGNSTTSSASMGSVSTGVMAIAGLVAAYATL